MNFYFRDVKTDVGAAVSKCQTVSKILFTFHLKEIFLSLLLLLPKVKQGSEETVVEMR